MNDCFAIQRYRALNIIIFYVKISQCLCSAFSISSLSSWRKLEAYLHFSRNFPLKNVYFYQGMTPISKVKTLSAFVSICVCNAQCKLEIPIVLHGAWSVGTFTPDLYTSLNWKYRKIDKWYTNEIVVNCCQINHQTDEISTRSALHPSFMIRKELFWKHEKNCDASTLLYTPTGDFPSVLNSSMKDSVWLIGLKTKYCSCTSLFWSAFSYWTTKLYWKIEQWHVLMIHPTCFRGKKSLITEFVLGWPLGETLWLHASWISQWLSESVSVSNF